MNELQINQKFKDLLPPLSDDELEALEQSILAEGVRESIKVWKNQIVDGHNRYAICQKYDLPFPSMNMHFADEDEALEWIYINQLARRNLSDFQRKHYIGKLYNLRKSKEGGQEGNKNAAQNDVVTVTQSFSKRTSEQIAADFGVSEKTVRTAGKIVEILEAEPELEQQFLAGRITQKEVIERTKETSFEFEIGRIHSERILRKVHALRDTIRAAERSFQANGLELKDYAPRLIGWRNETFETEAKKLAELQLKGDINESIAN